MNSETWHENALQILSQLDENWGFWKISPKLAYVDILADYMLTSKLKGGWIQWPDVQMLFKFQVNWIKIEDLRKLTYVAILVYVDLFAYGNHKIIDGWIQWPDM